MSKSRRKNPIRLAADAAGLSWATVYGRIKSGMTLQEAVANPVTQSPWSSGIKSFIANHFIGMPNQQLADLINSNFGTCFSAMQVKQYKKNHKLNSGLTGHFRKGIIPPNKGKSMEEFMSPETMKKFKANQYKIGNIPINRVPVGTEVIRDDGYTWRKIAEPNKWRQVHRLIYENLYGSIPSGKCITFLDGNNRNFNPDNLALISKDENKILNRRGLRNQDKDISMTGIALARLESTIYKRMKEAK